MVKINESDLMKGIDDKFQKLLSQFEMNMNILELNSKRHTHLNPQPKEGADDEDFSEPYGGRTDEKMSVKNGIEGGNDGPSDNSRRRLKEGESRVVSADSSKEKKDWGSERSVSLVTVKDLEEMDDSKMSDNTNGSNTPRLVSRQRSKTPDQASTVLNSSADDPTMESVLKYISECAEIRNKDKKKKKIISFEKVFHVPSDDALSLSAPNIKKNKVKTRNTPSNVDEMSVRGSKKNRTNKNKEAARKFSSSATNVTKKARKRSLRNIKNNVGTKDWINYNRNNIMKIQNKVNNKTEKSNDGNKKLNSKRLTTKVQNEIVPEPQEVVNSGEQIETAENILLNDLFKSTNRDKFNELIQNPLHEKITFSINKIPLTNNNKESVSRRINYYENIKKNASSTNEGVKLDAKKVLPDKKNMDLKKNVNLRVNQRSILESKSKTIETRNTRSIQDMNKTPIDEIRDVSDYKSEIIVKRSKSEIKEGSKYLNSYRKEEERGGYLEDVKVELDEFFSEIPFVVGRSISRTFNLGLSFQHAMSLLKRVSGRKEAKEVWNSVRPESVATCSESFQCGGVHQCEALLHASNWNKEDEEAWEENPWDAELNRRRPKCSCLPNSCTTLKNVLRQLTIKAPGYNIRTTQPSQCSVWTNKQDFELEGLRRPDLKRAQSQTRTELLRNIRNIQLQLIPSSEILQ